MPSFFSAPQREYIRIAIVAISFAVDFLIVPIPGILLAIAFICALPTFQAGVASIFRRAITIDTFNALALSVSFILRDAHSAAFIVLMLTSAEILDHITERRASTAVRDLLALKPERASVDRGDHLEDIAAGDVRVGDIVIVRSGERVPVDGIVVFGRSAVNEAHVTGESIPVDKVVGDSVLSGTRNEGTPLKIRATRVGKDSTVERMAELMQQAAQHKSRSERIADKFAGIFLPIVVVIAAVTFMVTKNVQMTAALFLVACADDMALAIPMAMLAAMGAAARRGVLVKGGQWFDTLRRIRTLVLDKTGTLTFGAITVQHVDILLPGDERTFWRAIARAEKFSEHPIGRAIARAALQRVNDVPDPDDVNIVAGSGIVARSGTDEIIIGNASILPALGRPVPEDFQRYYDAQVARTRATVFLVLKNGQLLGSVGVSDAVRPEAQRALSELKSIGVERVVMFTGDTPVVADAVARKLGIREFRASMKPEEKVRGIEQMLAPNHAVAMVGDGVNDAPALTRADVGIAMGGGGTAIAVEAADVVVLSDSLAALPYTIRLARHTMAVIRGDIAIWAVTNVVGFALVLTGVFGPAFAAFYNFATDFLPLLNSARLLRLARSRPVGAMLQ